jgi:hypothetical protein
VRFALNGATIPVFGDGTILRTPLQEGLERTLAYYREARAQYW